MTTEMKCQTRNRTIEHSDPESDPEMFTVVDTKGTRVECLAHAAHSESRGSGAHLIRR